MLDIEPILDKSTSEIFSNYNLHQIQNISDELAHLSSSKHRELRTLVSSKYRDLLKTGDDIIAVRDLGISQDHGLYALSFFRSTKLEKISTVERNFKILNDANFNRPLQDHDVLDCEATNTETVLLNSEFWIHMTSLLETNATLGLDSILQKLIDFHIFANIPDFQQLLFNHENMVHHKLAEISTFILDKLSSDTFSSSHLSQIYQQIHGNNLTELERLNTPSIDLEIFNNLIQIIDSTQYQAKTLQQYIESESSNDEIFIDFPEFNSRFQLHICGKLKSLQVDLNNLVLSYVPDSFIDLYDLEFRKAASTGGLNDNEYLLTIYYLSNGVDNGNLVNIIEKLTTFKHLQDKLNKFFNSTEDAETYSVVFEAFIQSLKSKPDIKNNTTLNKYLETLRCLN